MSGTGTKKWCSDCPIKTGPGSVAPGEPCPGGQTTGGACTSYVVKVLGVKSTHHQGPRGRRSASESVWLRGPDCRHESKQPTVLIYVESMTDGCTSEGPKRPIRLLLEALPWRTDPIEEVRRRGRRSVHTLCPPTLLPVPARSLMGLISPFRLGL